MSYSTIILFLTMFIAILKCFAIENKVDICNAEQFLQNPCRCCKMDCWYSIAKVATHELGHMPGQAGEEEALATLRLIRACMITECSPVCASTGGIMGMMKKRRRLPASFIVEKEIVTPLEVK